jgi:Glycosyl hydrolase catalytic core
MSLFLFKNLLLFIVFSLMIFSSRVYQPFWWGVTGHPLAQEAYFHIPITTQLDLISEIGASWYRCDWPQSAENNIVRIEELISESERRNIKLFPILFPTTSARDSNATPEQIRSASFVFARNTVSLYKTKVHYWELDNELETYAAITKGEKTRKNKTSLWGMTDGTSPEEFEEIRYQKVKAEFLGLLDGIKAADKTAKTAINAGWLHYGFIERLVNEDKVPFDILAWHWYSDMGDIRNVRGKFNLLKQLKQYGKPLLITEMNQKNGSMNGNENAQAKYLNQTFNSIGSNSGIKGMFIYELLDEPYFGKDNGESHYGLVEVKKSKYNKWQVKRKKKAFKVFQSKVLSSK